MPSLSEGKPDLLELHTWCPEFDQVREPIQGYNEAYLKTLTTINPNTDDITLFVNADDPGLLPTEEAKTILNFSRTVRKSEHFREKEHTRLVAVVHDCDSAAGRSRDTDYPLRADTLLEVLSVPRLKSRPRVSGLEDPTDAAAHEALLAKGEQEGASYEYPSDELPEAKRRLVLIVNLDESVLWALIKTVSQNQAAALSSFISNHLNFKASVDAFIPPSIPTTRTFQMKFHLPYYALGDSSKRGPLHDFTQLKNMRSIDFIRGTSYPEKKPPSEYIHQVEISCLVTGQDSHIWTGHTILDGCHKYLDADFLQDYRDINEDLGRYCDMHDPISGDIIAHRFIKPREFFLQALELRTRQVSTEWQTTLGHILKLGQSKRDSYDESLEHSLKAGARHEDEAKDRFSKKAYSRWIQRTRKLMERMRRSLKHCTSAWEAFPGGDLRYFIAPGNEWDMTPTHNYLIIAIKKNFDKMNDMLQDLDTFDGELKNAMDELGRHLEYENNEAANIQIDTAKDVKVLTWVTFLSLPFTLVAAFMSARSEILPLPETIATPFISLIIIEAVVWFVLYWSANGPYVMKVKSASNTVYYWFRHAVRYKEGVEPAAEAQP
ncbi:hypothetical protein PGQ11_015181 [Apiospora arundinis]|uniref:Uncharacterized protein n=1 Tax=Apiospora arundinis TaxID=335852 RepID=A0ABR2HKL8_9PEZI